MIDHRAESALATAQLLEFISRGQALQAAIIRNASRDEIDTIRAGLMSVAEAYADHTEAAALAVRQIIEP